jgi:hypothetical protein
MPTVPQEYVPYATVAPQGQLQPNQIDKASPADFGGQVGQALDQAGNMMEQHAVARQQIINAAAVDDVYANKFNPAFRAIYMDYYKLQGKDAEAAFPAVQKQMQDLANETAASLDNPMQQKAFNEIARRRMASDLDGMARYAAQQTNSWINQTTDAMGNVYSTRILDNRQDPGAVAGYIENIKNLYAAQGQNSGTPKAIYEAKAAQVIDSALQNAILTEAGDPAKGIQGNPANAENLYNQYQQFLSGDQAKQHAQAMYVPKLEEQRVNTVYTDLSSKFNPADPNVNPQDALNYIRDPKNYAGQITDAQRTTVANTFLGDWHRAGEIQKTNQSLADNSFVDAINKGQIAAADQFNAWKDPTTGLPASPKLVQSAIDRSLRGASSNPANRQTLVDLSDAVSNRGLTDSAPINQAYLDGKIDKTERTALLGLQDKMQHPERDPWFKQAEQMYKDRYGAGNADAHALYPQFINNLQQNIQEQGLKGHQIYEMAQKMLEPVDNAVVRSLFNPARWFGSDTTTDKQEALGFAKQWGGWPKPVINQGASGAASPAAPSSAPPSVMSETRRAQLSDMLKANGVPTADANIQWLDSELKKQGK